jgi:hypothetical protein
MTWTQRIGNAARDLFVLAIDLFTIVSELLKQVAIAVDRFADDLKEAVEPKKEPPAP